MCINKPPMSKTRPVWPASATQPADWPRLAEAPGSLKHGLAPKEASGKPAGRRLSPACFRHSMRTRPGEAHEVTQDRDDHALIPAGDTISSGGSLERRKHRHSQERQCAAPAALVQRLHAGWGARCGPAWAHGHELTAGKPRKLQWQQHLEAAETGRERDTPWRQNNAQVLRVTYSQMPAKSLLKDS